MIHCGDAQLIPHRKVPYTAAVLIPPESIWPPIQVIRCQHDPQIVRCAYRGWDAPYFRSKNFGFRVVMAVGPSGP